MNDRFWPILLKNSISAPDLKIRALTAREALLEVGGYQEELMSQPRASERPTSNS